MTLYRTQDLNFIHQVCVFRMDWEKQDCHLGLWFAEAFLTTSLKPPNIIQQNVTGSKIAMFWTKFVFFGWIGKTWWPPLALIGWDIMDIFSETAEWNSTKLDREQELKVFCEVFFQADRKKLNKITSPSLIGRDIFYLSSETADWNSTKLHTK